jgi:cytochrome c
VRISIAVSTLFVLTAACGGSAPATRTTTAATPTFADQVERGGQLYGAQCASCHGAAGEGGGAPRVVGLAEGALPVAPREGSQRTAQFVTVGDVASFVVATMPPSAPGSLPEADYWAILAFDLHANGIDLDRPLDGDLAATLTIPR